jgi:ATP-dependent helicase/nuclease subunit A
MFGLDDNVLLSMALTVRPPYCDKLLQPGALAGLDEPRRQQVTFALELLASLRRQKDALGPARLIETLLERTGYAAVLLSQFHGRRKLGNVYRLLDAARAAEASGEITLADLVRRLGEFVIKESRYEQAVVASQSDDVVRLMTIHKAKGLEFPVVFIPDLNARPRGPVSSLLLRQDWGITYKGADAPPDEGDGEGEAERAEGEKPLSYVLAKEAEQAESRAEDVRRLYVAATRHEDHLVLVGADVRRKDGTFHGGSYLAQLDGALGIAGALDAGRGEIAYGQFAARVARIAPAPAPAQARQVSLGWKIVDHSSSAGAVADGLAAAGQECNLPLVGPLTEAVGRSAGTIAATALSDFETCPMLYRWRHEFRVPPMSSASSSSSQAVPPAPPSPYPLPSRERGEETPSPIMDAATAGTIYHRCLELADMSAIHAAQAGALAGIAAGLVGQCLSEMEIDVGRAELSGELAGMLAALRAGPLLAKIVGARQVLRELEFAYDAGAVTIGGKIDLLYQDVAGWHIVDYKSDRVSAGSAEAHAARYRTQMLIYLAAAANHLPGAPADATLYFLRSGALVTIPAPAAGEPDASARIAELAADFVRRRRAGDLAHASGHCGACPFAALCRR